ncbi:MAG: DivIVA domain-containing protein [Bacilli bacterium]|nr:DivIVA domain-containing protein [Bacilli bacterium]
MAIKLQLNSQEILTVKFPNVPRGYDPLMVDEYLDKIIRDYKQIEANKLLNERDVANYENKIAALEKKNTELEIELNKYKDRLKDINENDNVTVENIDLVKRINQLEKFLYLHGYLPENIK